MPRPDAPLLLLILAALLIAPLSACKTAPRTATEREILLARADLAVSNFLQADPMMQGFFDTAQAWAVFPAVKKGGAGFGGARGRGVLYQGATPVGFADLVQGTFGLQLGGQEFSQIVFFDDAGPLNAFQAGTFAFSAQASAVAATAGASTEVDYVDGVAVFTLARGGLMVEAAIGGQRFDYVPR